MMRYIKLSEYSRSVNIILRRLIKDIEVLDTERYLIDADVVSSYLNSPESHSLKSVGPKTIDFICKEFDLQPPDAWKIRIDKYHEDRKDKDERKMKKERYVTMKINKIDADKLHDYLVLVKREMHELDKRNGIDNLLDKVLIPLTQKFDWKE